ncbi:unnamed protein product [Acanthoscelides obtectus]|uniref:Methyltransferase-like protein 22 n=1 Tax=Acanthoscelides obtectus TaxID=200917 RepID=A0A9P0L1M8_ACAOB|nr:unnamed protein product [Acanthoscelides obtectus]CAK1632733.1 Methyltransferase-like protein 22 [Acanthoscelides obtectus]
MGPQDTPDVMDDDDNHVSSEIYEEIDYTSPSKPTFNPSYEVSRFEFSTPHDNSVMVDSDGDLIVPRRKFSRKNYVDIENKRSTVLGLVGLQVWRGALLLADWLIYNSKNIQKGTHILELGSGVGLSSIIASMFSPVFCTDIDKGDIMPLIKHNVQKNTRLVQNPVEVIELNFNSETLPSTIAEALPNIPVIIAADVIYDDTLTDAFISTVRKLLAPPGDRSIYVALEKRYVFTIADCDSVAPCYEYFMRCLKEANGINSEELALDFPQYFRYERVKELAMWKLSKS